MKEEILIKLYKIKNYTGFDDCSFCYFDWSKDCKIECNFCEEGYYYSDKENKFIKITEDNIENKDIVIEKDDVNKTEYEVLSYFMGDEVYIVIKKDGFICRPISDFLKKVV